MLVKKLRWTSASLIFSSAALVISACGTTSKLPRTPEKFPEDHVLFAKRQLAPDDGLLVLRSSSQVKEEPDEIESGQPYSILLHSIQLPSACYDTTGSGDVLLVMDADDGRGASFSNLALYFQSEARPCSSLNGRNIVIFSSPGFDPDTPPFFRFQLIDVDRHDNKLLGGILGEIRKVSDSITEAYANPFSPIVSLGLKIGELATKLNRDDVIEDVSFQLFERAKVTQQASLATGTEARGPTIAHALRPGLYVLIGLPSPEFVEEAKNKSEFKDMKTLSRIEIMEHLKNKNLSWNVQRQRVGFMDDNNQFQELDVPAVVLEVVPNAQYAIPSAARRTLGELEALLDADSSLTLDRISKIGEEVKTSFILEAAVKTLSRGDGAGAVLSAIKLISAAKPQTTNTKESTDLSKGTTQPPTTQDLYLLKALENRLKTARAQIATEYLDDLSVIYSLWFDKDVDGKNAYITIQSMVNGGEESRFVNLMMGDGAFTVLGSVCAKSYLRRDTIFRDIAMSERLWLEVRRATTVEDFAAIAAQIEADVKRLPAESAWTKETLTDMFNRLRTALKPYEAAAKAAAEKK